MSTVYESCLWLLIIGLLAALCWQRFGHRLKQYLAERQGKTKRPFSLRPKKLEECPCCAAGVILEEVNPKPKAALPPWSERKKPGDPRNKSIPMAFIHDLTLRLAPNCIPRIVIDGLRQYFWVLTAHFGHWIKRFPWRKLRWLVDPRLLYAQLIKVRRGCKLKKTMTRVLCGNAAAIRQKLIALGFTGTVGTSFIERWNLTFRMMIAALTYRTWSQSQKKEKLKIHIQWGRAYYHFVRIHQGLTLAKSVPKEQRFPTPAMDAGLTRHRWSTLGILRLLLRMADPA